MFGYIQRARALAATVRRLEGEVGELQQTMKEMEQRCQATLERAGLELERARLENLAAGKRMEAESEKVGKAVTAMFEQIRLAKAKSPRPDDIGRRSGSGAP